MARHPKRSLGVLALLLAATAVTIGSTGANFTATAANPTNVFTAGTLSIGNTPNTALFTSALGLWKPGMSKPATVDIQNTGTVDGDFVLSATNITSTPSVPGLANKLTVKVEDCGPFTNGNATPPPCTAPSMTTIFAPATAGNLNNLALGTFTGGTAATSMKRRYIITVAWPSGTPAVDNPYQGSSAQFDLRWDAS